MRQLKGAYEAFWYQQLDRDTSKATSKGGNKLRSYRKVKQCFQMEPYLESIDNSAHRKNVTQLRLSAHRLNIEALRGTVTNPSMRKCTRCNLNETEDEEHFLLQCSAYSDFRSEFTQIVEQTYPNVRHFNNAQWFIFILTVEDKPTCKALGKFLSSCMIRRYQSDPSVV